MQQQWVGDFSVPLFGFFVMYEFQSPEQELVITQLMLHIKIKIFTRNEKNKKMKILKANQIFLDFKTKQDCCFYSCVSVKFI